MIYATALAASALDGLDTILLMLFPTAIPMLGSMIDFVKPESAALRHVSCIILIGIFILSSWIPLWRAGSRRQSVQLPTTLPCHAIVSLICGRIWGGSVGFIMVFIGIFAGTALQYQTSIKYDLSDETLFMHNIVNRNMLNSLVARKAMPNAIVIPFFVSKNQRMRVQWFKVLLTTICILPVPFAWTYLGASGSEEQTRWSAVVILKWVCTLECLFVILSNMFMNLLMKLEKQSVFNRDFSDAIKLARERQKSR